MELITKNYKLIVWHCLVAVLSFWMWSFNGHVDFNPITGLDFQPPAVGAFLLLISVMVLGYALFQNRRWALTSGGIVSVMFLLRFGLDWTNLAGCLIFLAFASTSSHRVKVELTERLKINVSHMLEVGLLPVVIGLFILISFAAYESPYLEQIKQANSLPSQTKVIFEQVAQKTIDLKITGGTPDERQQISHEAASQAFQEFNSWLKPYFQYAPPLLAFGLFLILWGVSFFFAWLGVAVGLLWFWILKKFGMVRIETKKVEAEQLVF